MVKSNKRTAPPIEMARTLGGRLRLVQMTANIRTDKDFAGIAGVSPGTMSAYLNDKQVPRRPVLIRIAQATETDLAWLDGSQDRSHQSQPAAQRDISPILWSEVPDIYGSAAGKVELVAFSQFSSGVQRLELSLGKHLDVEARIKLAVSLHDHAVSLIQKYP